MDPPIQTLELLDPPVPEGLLPEPMLWPWWVVGALAVLLLARGVWHYGSRRARRGEDVRLLARAEAMQRLNEVPVDDPRELALQVSMILRGYLVQVLGDPALYETHEEFVARHDRIERLSPGLRAELTDQFGRLAAMKYAEDPAAAVDAAALIADARGLLQNLHDAMIS